MPFLVVVSRNRDHPEITMKDISKLALVGLLGSGLVFTTSCGSSESTDTEEATEAADAGTHDCAGKNGCKGLGGCKVDADKLASLAADAGVDAAGEAHDCSGKNECKGLGGCKVDADKLAMLQAALAK